MHLAPQKGNRVHVLDLVAEEIERATDRLELATVPQDKKVIEALTAAHAHLLQAAVDIRKAKEARA
ncbi:MAG: hypothetical protein WCK39_01765 [Methanomassiliicoccales archaeon]